MKSQVPNPEPPRRPAYLVRPGKHARGDEKTIAFRLKEPLIEGLPAAAWERPWNTETQEYDDPEETEITVEDFAELGFVGPEDCLGIARRRSLGPDEYLHEIVRMQPIASMLTALVDEAGDVAATDTTFAIDAAAIAFPPGAVWPAGEAPTVVNNTLRIPAEDDAGVIAFYNAETELWEGFPQAYTTECP